MRSYRDAAKIAKTTGAQIVSNFEVCMYLNAQGVENINPGNTGGTIDCGPFKVSLTQALHSSGTTVNGQSIYLGSANGIVVSPKDGPSLYHMGDTDIFRYGAHRGDLCAKDWRGAGRRSFHHERKDAALASGVSSPSRPPFPAITGLSIFSIRTQAAFVAAMEGHSTKVAVPRIGEALLF